MPSPTQTLLDWVLLAPERCPLDEKSWDALIAQGVAHTVAQQLFRSLATQPHSIPPNVLQAAAVAMMWQKQQSSRIQRDLAAVLRALNVAGITPILLKGAHLASFVYADQADRLMSDIDLLVREEQTRAAEHALHAVGYTTSESSPRTRQTRMLKSNATAVEVHWAICKERDQIAVDHERLWARSHEVNVSGYAARVLSGEDLLLHICFHAGITHQFGEKGLRPLFDTLAIVDRSKPFDWSMFENRAKEWRIDRATYLMLEIARRDGHAAVPADVLAKLRPPKVSSGVYEAARAQMFEAPGVNVHPFAPLSIGVAWANPRATWNHLFRKENRKQEAVSAEMGGYLSQYAGFLWHCMLRDHRRLGVFFKRTRRHVVLSTWLAQRSGAKS